MELDYNAAFHHFLYKTVFHAMIMYWLSDIKDNLGGNLLA